MKDDIQVIVYHNGIRVTEGLDYSITGSNEITFFYPLHEPKNGLFEKLVGWVEKFWRRVNDR